jgi:flagellin
MALIMNHNLPALKTSRYVGKAYGALAKSIERLSTGLRINTAGDDAAGLAVRELMRADIAAGYQGIRNAADGVSLVQTAEGALGIIDEKLIKMKELAMQASTGTYSETERELINSEYQAMASEIDRIASSAVFNGVRLLDGSMNALNNGQGIKIHFGTGNSPDTDYYYIKTQDTRATSTTGLKIGGDGNNDIWSAGPYGSANGGCCGGTVSDLTSAAVLNQGRAFGYGYNWDGQAPSDAALFTSKYLAGRYGIESGMTFEELIGQVNNGTQSRIGIFISGDISASIGGSADSYTAICLDSGEVYYWGDTAGLTSELSQRNSLTQMIDNAQSASGLARAINGNANSKYWSFASGKFAYVFRKDGGNNDNLVAETKTTAGTDDNGKITYVNVETQGRTSGKGSFSLGGEHWGTLEAAPQRGGGYSIALLGKDIGEGMDLYITGSTATGDPYLAFDDKLLGITNHSIEALSKDVFTEVQDASNPLWDGGEVRTIESAERALAAVDDAIERKDKIRAGLGALQSRLESVIETQTIHMENLQAAESRISDVDVATEMTEFTKNNILAQAATAMLAQANSMANLALSLIVG